MKDHKLKVKVWPETVQSEIYVVCWCARLMLCVGGWLVVEKCSSSSYRPLDRQPNTTNASTIAPPPGSWILCIQDFSEWLLESNN